MKKVRLFINNSWVDISNKIINGLIVYNQRADGTFENGAFQFVQSTASLTNIEPFTPCEITKDDDSVVMVFASSDADEYLTKTTQSSRTLIHSVRLLEPIAITEALIVGTKTFRSTGAYHNDSYKVNALCALMTQKYGFTITANSSNLTTLINGSFDYVRWGAGTHFYTCLDEIADNYNCIVKANLSIVNNAICLEIYFKDLTSNTSYTFTQITRKAIHQNENDYGKILEGEFQNVVDRTNLQTVKGLFCRSFDSRLTADSAVLVLPSNIESIKSVKVHFKDSNLTSSISYIYAKMRVPRSYFPNYDFSVATIYDTWDDLLAIATVDLTIEDTNLLSFINGRYPGAYQGNWNVQLIGLADGNDTCQDYAYIVFSSASFSPSHPTSLWFDITDRVLEKQQYELLTPTEQTGRCYFKQYDNKIEGLNCWYRNDFSGIITRTNSSNVMASALDNEMYDYYNDNILLIGKYSGPASSSPVNYSFDVEYYASTDLMLMDEKSISQKKISRSYDANANVIDFDRLHTNIHKKNEQLGKPEMTIETTATPPNICDVSNIDGTNYYVMCVQSTFRNSKDSYVVELVQDYNKIADSIGVKTQLSSTKVDISTIVDRHIYIEMLYNSTIDYTKNLFLGFYFSASDTIPEDATILYKRATIFKDNESVYAIASADDVYAFGYQIDGEVEKPIPYVFSNNEAISMKVVFGINSAISEEYEKQLPKPITSVNYPFLSSIYIASNTIKIYKDQMERLIFTVKLK